MTNLIIQVSKYLIIILMALYTFQCFTVFRKRDGEARDYLFLRQNMLMFALHFVAFMVLYLQRGDLMLLLYYSAQVIYFTVVLVLFRTLYPLASRLLINNMCMLTCIGFIMITRLNYDRSVKQFKITVLATVIALLIPLIIRKLRFITKMYWFYTLAGIGLLALVAILARVTYGAKISLDIGGISIQPSEFVKIIYVFAIAGLLTNAREFKKIVIATALAAVHVLILVVSKDLGSAVIFFITYLVMLFVATRNPFLVLAGILSGSCASVGAYFLFSHIRVRVAAWRDPFQDYQGGSYQICQSLFAISAGGWLGTGLCEGSPGAIPFVEQDMMFSAICEELGGIFGICLILVCMSCFIMFVNISMQLSNRFYRLVAVGLGSTYAVQIFLTIGGGIKLIPLTGVTLPLVSYGGSSMLSTLIMFSIVQGLYMLQRDEERKDAEKRMQQEELEAAYAEDYVPEHGAYADGYRQTDDRYSGGYATADDRYANRYGASYGRYPDAYDPEDQRYADGYDAADDPYAGGYDAADDPYAGGYDAADDPYADGYDAADDPYADGYDADNYDAEGGRYAYGYGPQDEEYADDYGPGTLYPEEYERYPNEDGGSYGYEEETPYGDTAGRGEHRKRWFRGKKIPKGTGKGTRNPV